jgi:hypothetical protein
MADADKPIPEEDLDPQTRAQARKALHERKQKERQQAAADLKAQYAELAEHPALVDFLEKARSFAAYHNKLAVDGVGARNVGYDDNGQPILEDYYLTDAQVARELGSTSGLQQLIAYVENKLAA